MARVEGYINGRFITIIDDVVPSKDDPKAKKSKPEPLTEARVRAEYGFDIACIVEHFNYLLKGNTLAATLLPLTEVNIFYRIYEGVLLCAFANLLMPDSVDPKTVTIKPDLLDDTPDGERRKMENRNIGITVLRALGLFADIEVTDKINMEHPFGMIGILVQILRLSTTGQMHFRKFELLIQLFDGWTIEEEASSNLATERETILLIWINYQLKKAGTDFQLKDFGVNLSDSKAYSLLIWTVAPEDKRGSLISSDDIMSQSDLTKRAELVIANAAKLGIVGGLKPEHIANAGKQDINNPKGLHNIVLNLAFLFRIFLTYPNISVSNTKEESAAATPKAEPAAPKPEPAAPKAEPAAPKAEPGAPKAEPAAPKPEPAAPKPEPAAPKAATSKAEAVTPQKQVNELCKYGVQEDTLIRWLNSFGPSSPVVSLRTDLCNGKVLLEVWDAMYPGCVNWKAVKLQQVSAARRKFNWAVNCDIAIGIGEKHGISKNVCSSSNIASGDVKYIASMVFLMMRLHAQLTRKLIIGDSKAAELDDNGLVKWFNEKMEKFGNTFRLKNLEDPNLKKTNVLGFFGERILVECKLYSKGSEAAAWFFNSVDQVASDPALLKRFEALCLFMFSKAGIIVYASRLGPEIDTAVYRSVLMELNALSLRSK